MHISLLITIFIISTLLHMIIIRKAEFLKLMDIPNERSAHTHTIPRGAGIAIFLSVFITTLFFNFEYFTSYIYIYIAILLVFLVGLFDDRNDVSPRLKFIVLFFATILIYQDGISINYLGNYFSHDLVLPWFLIFPFTFFAIAGFTNGFNLIDGLDGLAGSISFVMLSTFFTIGMVYNDILLITLSFSFIAGVIAFLLFNWNPAKIFMGDSGSLTLGFVIAILSIKSIEYISPASVLFIIALPILDTFVVMRRRSQRGQSIFKADKNHMHHFLLNVKGDVRFTVILLVCIQIIFSILGFQLREDNDFLTVTLFILLFFVFLNLFDQRLRRRKSAKTQKTKKSHIKLENK